MCGILALARANTADRCSARAVARATEIVRHRGPDDEGFVLWSDGAPPRRYAGTDTTPAARRAHGLPDLPPDADWRVALGHRRLSIIDLSAAGHQPMVHPVTGVALCYNGEIFNHAELRTELEKRGHRFASTSDTEVLLHAWLEWGADCLPRLNGMFAFVLLDPRTPATLHAVRDRYGVKPLYVAMVGSLLAFASEVKQIRALPGFAHRLDEGMARDYLAYGLMDHTSRTLDAGISQLRGGERASVRLDDPALGVKVEPWYELVPRSPDSASDAAAQLRCMLEDSVRLRLRADVPVGSCLSGGIDSSAIVCLADRALRDADGGAGQITVTACYDDDRYDEWRFAEQVVKRARTTAVRVWPAIERLQAELDLQLWHLDEPSGSTSQFSQWCVFDGAAAAGLKVMLDGQGSDEQLAGYAGSDASLYAGMLRRGSLGSLLGEVASYRRRFGALPIGQLLLAARRTMPAIEALLPARLSARRQPPSWLVHAESMETPRDESRDLGEHLRRQLLDTSLPLLLRYEDRNSMAWSVESRVPFLDYRLVEFLAGIPDEMKTRRGVTKAVLRDAMRGVVPDPILDRRDKMGFVTPEKTWLRHSATQWFRDGVQHAVEAAPQLLQPDHVHAMMDGMIAGSMPFTFEPWRILCFGRWITGVATGAARPAAALAVASV